MIINVSAGHNPAGMIACGAVSILNESRENRIVKNEVIRRLRLLGHNVYDCTVDNGKNAGDVLSKCVAKCNANKVDLDIQIHFNAGASDQKGNGKTTGTECLIYNSASKTAEKYAKSICEAIAALGFKNRGVKVNPNLFYLKRTNAQAIIIECAFVDDKDDAMLYEASAMAKAIVYGITGQELTEKSVTTDTEATGRDAETAQGNSDAVYRVQVGAYKNRENAEKLQRELSDMGIPSYITKS